MRNIIFLLLADIIWGAAFVAQRTGGDAVGAYSFTSIRCFIGFLVLIPIIYVRDRTKARSRKQPVSAEYKSQGMSNGEKKSLIVGGIVCGIALCLATNFQQFGITMGSAVGKAGFLTACYILFVPILGLFFHRKLGWNVGLAVAMAVFGLYMLCMDGNDFTISMPDILLLLSAFCFAIQIMSIDHFAPLVDVVKLSCLEFLVCGIISAFPMFWFEMGHSLEGIETWALSFTSWDAWIPLLYAGVCSCGIGYTFQMVGQKNFNPTIASLIMSLESVFSVFFGWLLLGEKLSYREWIGTTILFLAIIMAQVKWQRKKD